MKLSVHIISSLFSALLAFAATSASGQTGTLTDSPALAASGENGTGPQAQTVSTPQTQAAVPESKTLVKVGDPVPDFTVKMFDGSTVDIASLKGKVVLINFWATWCPPCRREIPDLIKVREQTGDDVVILGVSVDEPDVELGSFMAKMGFNYPIYRDAGDIASGLNMTSIPRNLVFTPGGKLAYDDSGMLSEAGLLNLIDRAKRLK